MPKNITYKPNFSQKSQICKCKTTNNKVFFTDHE